MSAGKAGGFVSPSLPRIVVSTVRVRYKETDQMGIAHHSNYIVWFEVGRTDLCREAGLTYRTIEDRGYILVVTEVACRYRTPFRYDDEVEIRTSIGEAGSRMMRFDYALHNATGEVCATGQSRHIWLDRTTRKPVLPPRELIDPFRSFLSPRRS